MKICPKCKHEHQQKGTYCSRTCANSRAWTIKDKEKKSKAMRGRKFPGRPGKKHTSATKDKLRDIGYQRHKSMFEQGLMTERAALRKWIARNAGYVCSVCGIDRWNNKPITLQVDHIDGDAGNNLPSNLRLICPNCHSQSATFGARNKGKGRAARGLPLR